MSGSAFDGRPINGSQPPEPPMPRGRYAEPSWTPPAGVGAKDILMSLRRGVVLIAALGLIGGAIAAYIVHRDDPYYRATAVLRLGDERRLLVGDMERSDPERARTVNPLLSQIELLQSHALLEQVVNDEGLRLRPNFRGFAARLLTSVRVEPDAPQDSLSIEFADTGYVARTTGETVQGRYGQPLSIGGVHLTIAAKPRAQKVTWHIVSPEFATLHLRASMDIDARPQTDIIDVSYEARRPWLAQRVVNSIAERFKTSSEIAAQEQSRRRRIFLEEQLRITDSILSRAQVALGAQRSRTTVYSSRAKMEAQQQALTDLEFRINSIDSDRRVFRNLLSQVETAPASSEGLRALVASAGGAANQVVGEYFRQLLQHQSARDSLTTGPWRSAATNPDVQRLDALITATRANLLGALRSHLATLDGRSTSLVDARTRTAGSIQTLPGLETEEIRLAEDVEATRRTAEQLRGEYQRARVAEAVETGRVEIVDRATMPLEPIGMPRPLRVVLGGLLGLMLGAGFTLLRDGLNTTVRRQADLVDKLGVSSLGVIPKLLPLNNHKGDALPLLRRFGGSTRLTRADVLVAGSGVPSPGIEAYRLLRTNILFSAPFQSRKTIVVTSAVPGEGKTTTAANLGITFARDGKKVLLVDCDLRRARLHRLFQMPVAPGLLDLLQKGELPPAIRSTQFEGLFLLARGTLPTNGTEVIRSGRMLALLGELANHFDLVIIDTPPVLAVADAVMLGAVADAVILVIRAGRTPRAEAAHVLQQFAAVGAPVAGAVLNDPSGETESQGEYAYRKYEYSSVAQ